MSATDANRELLALQSAAAVRGLLANAGGAALLCIKRVFLASREIALLLHINLSLYAHSYHNFTQTTGEGEGYCGQHA